MEGGLELDDHMGLFLPDHSMILWIINLTAATPNHFIFDSHHAFNLHVAGEAYESVFQTANLRSDKEVYRSHYNV